MDPVASGRPRRVALLVAYGAALLVAAAVYTALWTPGTLDLALMRGAGGTRTVTWVAPDGPAWSVGVRPGASLVRAAPARLVVRQEGENITLEPGATRVDPLDLAVAALGLCLLLLGAVVVTKGQGHDRRAAGAFWRMSLLIGLTLGVVPAGFHGAAWAIAVSFVALALFGPALLALTLVFPSTPTPPRRRTLLGVWLPAVALLPAYALCWWRPAPLFDAVGTAADTLLAAYVLAACGRLLWVWRHPRSDLQRDQLHWVALGLILGFLPLVGLNLLPAVLIGRDLAPPQVSILALVLLPLGVGSAIVRAEVFGITSLVRRRTLRVLIAVILLAGITMLVGMAAGVAARRWDWPVPAVAAGTSALTALGVLILRPRLTRGAERLLLRDVYDPADVVLRLSTTLSKASPQAMGALIVTHLVTTFNLEFALLLTEHDTYLHAHTRNLVPAAALEQITGQARSLLAAPAAIEPIAKVVAGVPVLLLPLGNGRRTGAVLCCGPKHSGDRYTPQDRTLLHALGHYLAARLDLQAQLDAQGNLLAAPGEATAQTALVPLSSAAVAVPLTRRELMVLRLIAQGLGNKEIAERLERDADTIEKHVRNLRRKLGVQASTEAVALARQQGLLPLE